MPWTVSDVDRFKKGLTPAQKQRWVRIANDALRRCQEKNGSNCDASAIRQANGVVGHQEYSLVTNAYDIREETYQGRKHLVVPVVMMVEGVHNGSAGPMLHTEEHLRENVQSWNGRPVTIGHPQEGEENISANTPRVMEEWTVGHIFNAHYDNGLKAEAWIDLEEIQNKSPAALAYIREGRPLEVSVGVFNDTDETEGEWNGETYEAIATNYQPDHLALLPGERGACSWTDGCGVRVNQEGGEMVENATVTGMEAKRKELGMSVGEFYAVPRDPPSESKLPIFDAAHVRNAMARFSQTQGLSSTERASARRKIIAKAHKFDIDTSGFEEATRNSEDIAEEKRLRVERIIQDNVDLGYRELVHSIQTKLDQMDTNDRMHFLQEVYDDHFIYSIRSEGGDETLYKRDYSIVENNVEFAFSNPVQVRRKVEYVNMQAAPIINEKKENSMACCEDKVDRLIANKLTHFSVEDKDWLMELNEEQIDKLEPIKVEPEVKEVPIQVNKDEVISEFKEGLKEIEDYTALMPEEMKEKVAEGVKLYKEHRDELVSSIMTNTAEGTWEKEGLEAMETKTLERIDKSVHPVDYSGGGNPKPGSNGEIQPMQPVSFKPKVKKEE